MQSSRGKVSRVVIDPDTAILIASGDLLPSPVYRIFAPALLKSQVLATLYARARSGELSTDEGLAINSSFAKLKFRYLGDAVMRRRAWAIAEQLGLSSTEQAEYVSLAQLQADAIATENEDLIAAANGLVPIIAPQLIGLER